MLFPRAIQTVLLTGHDPWGDRVDLVQFVDGGYGLTRNGEALAFYFASPDLDAALDDYIRLVPTPSIPQSERPQDAY